MPGIQLQAPNSAPSSAEIEAALPVTVVTDARNSTKLVNTALLSGAQLANFTPTLEEIWAQGYVHVTFVTPGSAQTTVTFNESAFQADTDPGKKFTIDCDGKTRLALGSQLAEQGTSGVKYLIYGNTTKSALAAGKVTVSEANQAVAGIVTCRFTFDKINWASTEANQAVYCGNEAPVRFTNCNMGTLYHAARSNFYTDQNSFEGCTTNSMAGAMFVSNLGDGVRIAGIEGLAARTWEGEACTGGTVTSCVQGGFKFTYCRALTMSSCHFEGKSFNPAVLCKNTTLKMEQTYFLRGSGEENAPVVVENEAEGTDAVTPSILTLENVEFVILETPTSGDVPYSADINLKVMGGNSRLRCVNVRAYAHKSTNNEHAPRGLLVTSEEGAVQTALTNAAALVEGGNFELANNGGTWEVFPLTGNAGIASSRRLEAPSYQKAPAGYAGTVGALPEGAKVAYVMAMIDPDGNYTTLSPEEIGTVGAQKALAFVAYGFPGNILRVWYAREGKKASTEPEGYCDIGISSRRIIGIDTGEHLNGLVWIKAAIPVPATVAKENKTWEHIRHQDGTCVGHYAGNPEGFIAAPAGSLCTNTAAGTLYTKSAAGTAGWAAVGPPSGAAGGSLEGNYPAPTLANGTVTAAKLGSEAVETGAIKGLAVTAVKIAAEAIEAAKIKSEAVTTAKLATGAVATTKALAPTTPSTKGEENKVQLGTAGVMRGFVAVIEGNGVETKFKIKHGLEKQAVQVAILTATFEQPVTMLAKSVAISLSEVEVTFTVAPGAKVANYIVITG